MNSSIIASYVDQVYGYAVNHTFSREEADDLSQEILFTLVRELPKLRDDSKFEAWVWGVAGNVTKSFRRSMGKQRAMYSYDCLENLSYEDEFGSANEDLYDSLRTKIAALSAIYRDIIIFYYYDGLSISQISEKMKIPEGTIMWRLSEARKKIKKECEDMEETALHPVKLNIGITGSGNYDGKTIPFPSVYINDALSQNILYYCYEEKHSVEELAKLCGVPAYYIEERLDNLLKREALIEATKGKYQTNFIIWSDKHAAYCEENAEKALMPIMDRLLDALDDIAREAASIDFYKAEKNETDLYYLYGVMAFSHVCERYCTLPYPSVAVKYDGYKWCYVGHMAAGRPVKLILNINQSSNLGTCGSYSHITYGSINGITFRKMMYDNQINACEDILRNGLSEDIDSVANAIQNGYIVRREDGSFFVTTPAFTKAQKAEFNAIVEKYLAPLMPEYSEIVSRFLTGFKKLIPRHLSDAADRTCHNIFKGLYTAVIEYGQNTGRIKMPSQGCFCDVLLQLK